MRVIGKDVILCVRTWKTLFGSRYWLQQGTYITNASPRTLLLSAEFNF